MKNEEQPKDEKLELDQLRRLNNYQNQDCFNTRRPIHNYNYCKTHKYKLQK